MRNKIKVIFSIIIVILLLSSCAIKDGPPDKKIDVSKITNAIPKVEPLSKYGNPKSYVVDGRRYYVLEDAKGYDKVGIASWYGTKFHDQLTSTREAYDLHAMTAASTTLPLPTYVEVTNLENDKHVIVKVNDRGPFNKNRIIDLSYVAAKKLGYVDKGTAKVRVVAIDPKVWLQKRDFTKKLYLQIGIFKNENNANKLRKKVINIIKYPININMVNKNHTVMYLVQVGPFRSTDEKDHVKKLLKSEDIL